MKGSWLPLVSLWLGFSIHCPQAKDVSNLFPLLAQVYPGSVLGPFASSLLRAKEMAGQVPAFCGSYVMTAESECR